MKPERTEVTVLPAAQDTRSLMAIIDRAAMDPQFDVAKLQALLAVKKEWEADEARKAFVVALNAFKAHPPVLKKDRQVDFLNKAGTRTKYKHAGLDQVSGIIGAALAEHGISHTWSVETVEGGKLKVSCKLTHAQGHSETVTLPPINPDESGGKNAIQGLGSAITYAQRYSLLAATGMAVGDADDDGQGGEARQMDEKVKLGHLEAISKAADSKALESLWAAIASECTKAGDVPAYEELKGAVRERAKALKAAKATAGAI